MTPDAEHLLILQNWFSPAFPVGAFSYSGGLETAIARGDVYDSDSLAGWLTPCYSTGSIFTDAVFLRATMDGEDVNDLCLALCAGAERYQETTELGAAFAASCAGRRALNCRPALPIRLPLAWPRTPVAPHEATVAAFPSGRLHEPDFRGGPGRSRSARWTGRPACLADAGDRTAGGSRHDDRLRTAGSLQWQQISAHLSMKWRNSGFIEHD